ncbi:MAG TPA: DUF1080 domain-containing protein [Isosphaeraceae bacterium]|nr:DUF1080 domain-containing protein [Isosphaeraceae bacterium]
MPVPFNLESDPMPLLCRVVFALLAQALVSVPALAEEEPGFKALFNGQDLSGWRLGQEKLDGKTGTADGRFRVADGVIRVTGATTSDQPKTEAMETLTTYSGDFILRLEFRASRGANSGLHLGDLDFKHQLQIRDYPNVGPYKDLKHYKAEDWNRIEVSVTHAQEGKGSVARCTCNGELLEEALPIPGTGSIGLQSETNILEYRNIRIRRLD